MTTAVVWLRRDLRLSDNPALVEAVRDADDVIALFCLDPALLGPAGAPRRAHLLRTLRALDQAVGGDLMVRHGDPADVVPAVAVEGQAAPSTWPRTSVPTAAAVTTPSPPAWSRRASTWSAPARRTPSRPARCWREFYADVLFHEPASARQSMDAKVGAMPWDRGADADELFEAWAGGRTGYPIVDAGMRQLLAEGWMHNRLRMITASFLVKDLHLGWQRGARWFMQHLVDGDLASNQHGWQWTAGTGTDPSPFFRIFNPTTQGERFDPDGSYVRRYVPELAGVAARWVHRPHEAPDGPPAGYPAPIVDHREEREESLRRYQATR